MDRIQVEITEMSADEREDFFWQHINKAVKAEKYADLPGRAFKADSQRTDARAIGEALRNGCTVAELNEIA